MGLQQFSSSLPTSYRLRNQREALVVGSEVREYDSPKSIVSESESEKWKSEKVKSEKWSNQFLVL